VKHKTLNAAPVTYNLLSNALCSKGLVIHAENLLELLRGTDTKLRTFAYTTLIKAQCAKGMPYKAIKWIGKLINADFEPSIEDFSAVINRLCKRDFAEEAFMFIHIMTSVFFFEIIL
jgi:pentatricopeptide repeat protein